LAQARVTALEAAYAGTAIDPRGLEVSAYVADEWDRGRVFVCEVGYNVRVDHLPMVSWFYSSEHVPLRARVSLWIEPYKSRWE
jgi:hypothetical protein